MNAKLSKYLVEQLAGAGVASLSAGLCSLLEFERAMIVERVRAGIARAQAKGTKSGRPIGRPRVSVGVERNIQKLRMKGLGQLKIAKQLGDGVSVVQRVISVSAG